MANAALELALGDVRMLFLVLAFDSAVSVLENAASQAANADSEVRSRFESTLQAARTSATRERQKREQQESRRRASPPPPPPIVLSDVSEAQTLDLNDETQVADPARLQTILGEVTLIADHYRDD